MPAVNKARTGSGKTKTSKEDQTQRSISSFFQAGSAGKTQKCGLFSEVGQNTGRKLALKKSVPKVTYTENSSKSPESADVIVINDCKADSNGHAHQKAKQNSSDNLNVGKKSGTKPESQGFTQVKTGNKQKVDCCENDQNESKENKNNHIPLGGVYKKDDIIVIPETQNFMAAKTPKTKGQDEDGIIPDTPQSENKEEMPKKRIFGRSFLTAGSNVAKNPYVMKREKVDKKQLSRAKKGLISVSVQFNPEAENKGQSLNGRLDSFVEGDSRVLEENKLRGHTNNNPIDNAEENQTGELRGTNLMDDAGDVTDTLTNMEQKHEEQAKTPTKIYHGERTSIKRMSKSGDSPDCKRRIDEMKYEENGCRVLSNIGELMESNSNSHQLTSLTETISEKLRSPEKELEPIDFKDHKTFQKETIMNLHGQRENASKETVPVKFKGHTQRSNIFKVNSDSSISYQLSSSRRKKKDPSSMSVEGDSCLDSILTELDQKSCDKSSEVTSSKVISDNKSFKPSVISLKKNRRSISKHQSVEQNSKLRDNSNDHLSDADLKYIEDIDVKVHLDVGKSLNGNGELEFNGKTPDVFQKPNFLSKKKSSAKRSIDSRKVSTETSQSDDIVPTQTIVEILSQLGKDENEDEMDIDEFVTQPNTQKSAHKTVVKSCDKSVMLECDKIQPACVTFGRHTVTQVDRNVNGHDVCLHVVNVMNGDKRECILSGFWADTHVFENDIVHISGKFEDGRYMISDSHGLIIVNPDVLLSGTTVVSSVFCMRKGVLNEKFKGCDGGNVQMLYGSIIHCVFQQVLQKKLTTEEEILKDAEKIVKDSRFIHDMYKGNVTEAEVLEEIKKYIPQIRKWLEQYTDLIKSSATQKKEDIRITKVTDIEENIWSPRFGVKGKIDLTVEVQIKNKGRQEKSVMPLELKTGRTTFSMEHKGQVTLYSMMSSDRRPDPGQGLLLYLKEPDMKLIPANHLNIRGLIQLRNEMAYYLSRQVSKSVSEENNVSYHMGRLPEPINNQRACLKCAQLTNCSIYQRSIEQKSLNSSMATLVPNTLTHLQEDHLAFYVHWCLLLDLESKASTDRGGVSDLWCKTGQEREQDGCCISGLGLSDHQSEGNEGYSVISFTRHSERDRFYSTSINMVGIAMHDYMIISTERTNHLALCNGTVVEIDEDSVKVAVESESIGRLLSYRDEIFRLDRYAGFSTANILYTNVSRLMMDEPRSEKLRQLIIERKVPEFVGKLSKSEIEKVKQIFKPLNKPQKTAVLKVLMSKDFVLIKGYPGTGKTATIVAIVRVLNLLGLSVLLTSYTHSAVDNILLKLLKHDVKFVRLGKTSKIHPLIQKYSADVLTKNIHSVGDLRQFYSQQKVVATSCLGVNHSVFTQRKFDVCIVDEASQVLLPACLGPLFCADRFVLVGDPKQLPPVVQSREARGLGMDQSLFALLDGDGGGTYELYLQYRMNRQIMALSNLLVYSGALQCGSDAVGNSQLQVDTSRLTETWMVDLLHSDRPAVFLDTSKAGLLESKNNSGMVVNTSESRLVQCITSALQEGGIHSEDIGVIAPYRHQVRLIHDSMTDHSIEVNTVDQYQGRDKDVIIISFTRSFKQTGDEENKSGELLKDVRRLNVAVSRAKKKLIMVGDTVTLKMYQPVHTILSMMEKDNLIVTLPPGSVS